MWIKIISPEKTDFYSGKLSFATGVVTSSPAWDPDPVCGRGIHFSNSLPAILQNTRHQGKGYLIEVCPIGDVVKFDYKFKSKSIKVMRFLTIPEWLEELKADDPGWLNLLLRAAKLGLEELKADGTDWLNRRLRAAKLGLEELKADDTDWLNRLLRAAKTGEWDSVFKILK